MLNATHRKANLDTLISWAGSIAEIARATGVNEKYISQVKNAYQGPRDRAPRQFGSKAQRDIEVAYHLPRGWFDMSPELAERHLQNGASHTVSVAQQQASAAMHVRTASSSYSGSVFSAQMTTRLAALSPDALAMLEAAMAHILDSYDAAKRKAQLNG